MLGVVEFDIALVGVSLVFCGFGVGWWCWGGWMGKLGKEGRREGGREGNE